MDLTITLSEFEKSNMGGWVNFLLANPQYIGKTKLDGLPPREDGIAPWQTRIVLEEQTRERFEQIARQFGVSLPPVVVPPAEAHDFCDINEDIRWTIPFGDFSRYCTRDVRDFRYNRVCASITLPGSVAAPFTFPGYVSLAEFDGSPTMRHMTLSRHACDFRPVDPTGVNGPLASSYGKQATIYFNAFDTNIQGGAKLIPGQPYFVNVRNWSLDTNDPNVLPPDSGIGYAAGISVLWPHN